MGVLIDESSNPHFIMFFTVYTRKAWCCNTQIFLCSVTVGPLSSIIYLFNRSPITITKLLSLLTNFQLHLFRKNFISIANVLLIHAQNFYELPSTTNREFFRILIQ